MQASRRGMRKNRGSSTEVFCCVNCNTQARWRPPFLICFQLKLIFLLSPLRLSWKNRAWDLAWAGKSDNNKARRGRCYLLLAHDSHLCRVSSSFGVSECIRSLHIRNFLFFVFKQMHPDTFYPNVSDTNMARRWKGHIPASEILRLKEDYIFLPYILLLHDFLVLSNRIILDNFEDKCNKKNLKVNFEILIIWIANKERYLFVGNYFSKP